MKPYFADTDKQALIIAAAHAWVDAKTPFVEHQAIRGAGADCVYLSHALQTKEAGFPHEFTPPHYTMEQTLHSEISPLVEYLEARPELFESHLEECVEDAQRLLNKKTLMVGDLLVFQLGKGPHHSGVMLKWPYFVHTLRGLSCHISQINDTTFSKRFRGFYRAVVAE